MSSTPPLLEVRGLVSGYGKHIIVQGVSLRVSRNVVTIIGANGSGKSTLLKSIMAEADVFSGQVLFGGEDVTKLSTNQIAKKGLGYVPQLGNTFGGLNVDENLDIGGYSLSRDGRKAAKAEIYGLFPELSRLRRSKANVLSGGERQMLAIGRALMGRPKMLLLDEPTAALSPKSIQVLHLRIKDVTAAGTPVLMVEQNVRGALAISDYTYLLASGKCAYEGPSREIDPAEVGRLFLSRGQVGAP